MHDLIKFIANYFIIIPVIAALTLFVFSTVEQRKRLLISLIIGGIITLGLAKIGSYLYSDPRPFVVNHALVPLISHSTDNGFPSDHTLLSSFIAFTLLAYAKKLGVILLAVATVIGIARVLAHVHHVPDIIGSFCFSALGAAIGLRLIQSKSLAPFHEK